MDGLEKGYGDGGVLLPEIYRLVALVHAPLLLLAQSVYRFVGRQGKGLADLVGGYLIVPDGGELGAAFGLCQQTFSGGVGVDQLAGL